MTKFSISDFKRLVNQVIDQVSSSEEIVIIQRKGQDCAVLISYEEYKNLITEKVKTAKF